jgi:ubiquitin carboxyl-terminal hydrolase 25/28
MMQAIGFGCKQDVDVLRVGPLTPHESLSLEQVKHMDRYMMRTWVEVSLVLAHLTVQYGKFVLRTVANVD